MPDTVVPDSEIPKRTVAMKYLEDLARHHRLRAFARDHGMDRGGYGYLWQLKAGLRRPGAATMRLLSDFIAYDDWFTPAE